MIEVLFGESEAASMKMAKGRGHIIGSGADSREIPAVWMEGEPGQVVCLGFMLDIGDIREPVEGRYRRDLILSMYQQDQWEENTECARQLEAGAGLYARELARLAAFLEQGEPVRIWYGDSPYSRCGFYFLCRWMKPFRSQVRAVKLPEYRVSPKSIVEYHNWGEIGPEEFVGFLSCERLLTEEERRMYAMAWSELVEDNSPLRAMVNGKLTGVPADFYDFLIWKRLTEKPVKQCRLIGDILGRDPLNVGDWWYAARIEHYIAQGRIRVTEDSGQKYARTICLA